MALSACSGCAGGEAPTPESSVTRVDSAGVEIVMNRGDPATLPEWSLDPTPRLDIGSDPNDPDQQLFRVRAAVRLPDGRIVIANAGSHELRFYDEEGDLSASVGGEGDGPGEFRGMGGVSAAGDSIYVWDNPLRRLSVFDAAGTFGRDFGLEPPAEGAVPGFLGRFENGSMFASYNTVVSAAEFQDGEVLQRPIAFLLYSPDGSASDSLASFMGGPSLLSIDRSRDVVTAIRVRQIPFSTGVQLGIGHRSFAAGTGDAYEIWWFDQDGSLRRLVRRDAMRATVTEEMIADYIRAQLEEVEDPNTRREERRALEALPYPARVPAFGDLRLDRVGNLWVQEPELEGDAPGSRWIVFDPTGAMTARATLPEGFTALEIGEDYALGRWTDELDIEHVRMHRLVKS